MLLLVEVLEELIEEAIDAYCDALPPDSPQMRSIMRAMREEEQYRALQQQS